MFSSLSIVGVTIISNADKGVQNYFPPGAVWSILGAFFYAAYVVLLRRKVDNEDMLDIPMFFGKFKCIIFYYVKLY